MKAMKDQIFEKQVYNEFVSIGSSFYIPARQIRMAAIRGKGLKELSTLARSSMCEYAEYLASLVNTFAAYRNLSGSDFDKKYQALYDFSKSYAEENKIEERNEIRGLEAVVNCLRFVMREINKSIALIQTAYKVSDSNDVRWNTADAKSVLSAEHNSWSFDDDITSNWEELDKLAETLKKDGSDITSQEYGKLIVKQLRSFKADIVSGANKYFGKATPYAPFDIVEMITV